ncbi:MAG: hypothetical protein D6748_08270, partial [Calditrichaeota bacterium]
MRKILVAFFCLSVLLIVNVYPQARVSARLQRMLQEAEQANTPIRVLVMLTEKVDISRLDEELYAQRAEPAQRAFIVITTLMEKAEYSQRGIISYLEKMKPDKVIGYKRFWIVNLVMVEAYPEIIRALAMRDDVDY